MTSRKHQTTTAKAPTSRSTKRTWCALSCGISMPKSYLGSSKTLLDQPRLPVVRTFAAINLEAGS